MGDDVGGGMGSRDRREQLEINNSSSSVHHMDHRGGIARGVCARPDENDFSGWMSKPLRARSCFKSVSSIRTHQRMFSSCTGGNSERQLERFFYTGKKAKWHKQTAQIYILFTSRVFIFTSTATHDMLIQQIMFEALSLHQWRNVD